MKLSEKITVKLSEEAREKLEFMIDDYGIDVNSIFNGLIIRVFQEEHGIYVYHKTALKLDCCEHEDREELEKFLEKAKARAMVYMNTVNPKVAELMEKYPK